MEGGLAADKSFQKFLQAGEVIAHEFKVTKVNKRSRSQERVLVLTTLSLMNVKGKKLKRRIGYEKLGGVTKSLVSEEFIVHIPSEYDYRFATPHKDQIVSELGQLVKGCTNQILYIWAAYEVNLKEFATTKADKKKGIHKMPNPQTAINSRQAIEESKATRDVRTKTIFAATENQSEVTLADFKILSVVGRGSFGKVMLVEKNDTKAPYAMKSLRKDTLLERGQVEHTRTEKQIMQHINHPFLVKLEYAFSTEDKVFFIMAFMRGGELFFHLKNLKKFSEDQSRFICACIILGLGHLHAQGFVYRDLKPENILLDESGYACLTDFGMAKFLPEGGSTMSFVGTPEYLAPEIISGLGHNMAADWWSVGILLYELMVSIPPFYNQNIQLMYELIQHGELRFPTRTPLSSDAEDLISRLLNRNPRARLGANGVEEVKCHPFFQSIDWEALHAKQLEPVFVPPASEPKSTVNVDEEFTSEDAVNSLVPQHKRQLVMQHQGKFKGL